jgi:hypothetical protein
MQTVMRIKVVKAILLPLALWYIFSPQGGGVVQPPVAHGFHQLRDSNELGN